MSEISDVLKAGRPKGAINKGTANLRKMVLQALDGAGGVKYLERQAHANPVAFLSLLSKIMPVQMKLEADGIGAEPVHISLSWLEPGKRFSGAWRDAQVLDVVPVAIGQPAPASGIDDLV